MSHVKWSPSASLSQWKCFDRQTASAAAKQLVTTVALPSGSTSLETQTLQYTVPCIQQVHSLAFEDAGSNNPLLI